uniref:LRRCT domain-containing protein n=1 Tax=Macrostomum lignano TaxID=282301 RepID=A0A1I8FF29_9PLAT
ASNISQLEHGWLLNLTGLQLIDLSDNQLRHFVDHRSLAHATRAEPERSARARLVANGQANATPVCDCPARLRPGARRGGARRRRRNWRLRLSRLAETGGTPAASSTRRTARGGARRLGHISDARHEDFLCVCWELQRQPLPDRFCPTVRNCTARCLHGCACYRSPRLEPRQPAMPQLRDAGSGRLAGRSICRPSELICPGLPAGRLRRVSKQSLRWSSAGLSAPLTELMLNSSGVEVVEPDALDFNQSVGQLWLNNNSLAGLDPAVFNSLAGVRTVWLSGNPWRCSCDAGWLTLHRYLNRTALDGAAAGQLYELNDAGRLVALCDRIAEVLAQRGSATGRSCQFGDGHRAADWPGLRLLQLRHRLLLHLRLRLLRTADCARPSLSAAVRSVENFDVFLWLAGALIRTVWLKWPPFCIRPSPSFEMTPSTSASTAMMAARPPQPLQTRVALRRLAGRRHPAEPTASSSLLSEHSGRSSADELRRPIRATSFASILLHLLCPVAAPRRRPSPDLKRLAGWSGLARLCRHSLVSEIFASEAAACCDLACHKPCDLQLLRGQRMRAAAHDGGRSRLFSPGGLSSRHAAARSTARSSGIGAKRLAKLRRFLTPPRPDSCSVAIDKLYVISNRLRVSLAPKRTGRTSLGPD